MDALADGTARETPQDERMVTYAPRLTREDGAIDWNASAIAIHNQVRGLHPWPHAFTSLNGARVIVHRSSIPAVLAALPEGAAPGVVVSIDRDRLPSSSYKPRGGAR